jgi:hypothetical protein
MPFNEETGFNLKGGNKKTAAKENHSQERLLPF